MNSSSFSSSLESGVTQEVIRAEYSAICAISKGLQVAAATQDEWGQWHTFAHDRAVMPSLNDDKRVVRPKSHTFSNLLKWVKGNPHATHIVAFTNVPNEEPLILLKVKE